MNSECSVEVQSLVGAAATLMFVASELLALSKKTKANGIFHLILIYLEKKFRKSEEYDEVPYEESANDIENPECEEENHRFI